MKLDFSGFKITLVIAPVDMRSGFGRLSLMARSFLEIEVEEGNDLVIFVSRHRKIAKLIWADEKGSCILTRHLYHGLFERFLAKSRDPSTQSFSVEDLMAFLDGKTLYSKRNSLL